MKKFNSVTVILAAVVLVGGIGVLLATQLKDRVENSAKKSYVFTTYLKGDDIKISAANDGVVTLTGTVSEWSHRSMAEETILGLPGVLRVENKLDVKGDQPLENSDVWLTMKVKAVLMFHRNVSYLNTIVDVHKGIVTLGGHAASEAQKELTTEYVRDIDGIQSVENNMAVEKTGKTTVEKVSGMIDDASITAQVKLALLFHRSTSALKTKVDTKKGIVTVSGVVKNGAEKDLVDKLVNDIKGVKGLKNNLTIGL